MSEAYGTLLVAATTMAILAESHLSQLRLQRPTLYAILLVALFAGVAVVGLGAGYHYGRRAGNGK